MKILITLSACSTTATLDTLPVGTVIQVTTDGGYRIVAQEYVK